jgi:hypothetical protein
LAVFISRAEFARVNYPSLFIANSKRQELTTTVLFLVYSRSLLSIILKKIMEIKFKYTVRGERGRGGVVRHQQPQGPPLPNPGGMPGLLQPPGPMDPMQRLALMMAMMVLGMPQVHSCHATTGHEMSWGGSGLEPRICPLIATGRENGISIVEEPLDPKHWKRLLAAHCIATQ